MHTGELRDPLDALKATITPIVMGHGDVLFAYIFGSTVKGTAHGGSDIDVAVYLSDLPLGPVGDRVAVDRQIEIALELEQAVGRRADVVVLNRASVDLRQNVLAHGHLLFCRDPGAHAAFRLRQLREHHDFVMLEPIFRRYRKRRIKEGVFGGGSLVGAKASRHH